MFKHYLEIEAEPYEGDLHFIVNKLFNRLHGIISQNELNLGLSFPKLSPRSPGGMIRVFGHPRELQLVLKNDGFSVLYKRGMIRVSDISDVPSHGRPVVYSRTRKPEKVTKDKVKRKVDRLRTRGLKRGESCPEDLERKVRDAMIKKMDDAGIFPFVRVERERGSFPIFIKKQRLEQKQIQQIQKFNRYGLGNGGQNEGGAVFDF